VPDDRFEVKGKKEIREHVKYQVHPIVMDKATGKQGVDILFAVNRVRVQYKFGQ